MGEITFVSLNVCIERIRQIVASNVPPTFENSFLCGRMATMLKNNPRSKLLDEVVAGNITDLDTIWWL